MSYTAKYLSLVKEATDPFSDVSPSMPERPSFIKPIGGKKKDTDFYTKLADIIATGGESDINFSSEGLVEVTYSNLGAALNRLDNARVKRKLGISAIVYGEAGIGKSAVMQARAEQRAAELGREFITIDRFLEQSPTIEEVQKNISQYFIFIDERAAGFDPSMMTGIPDPTSPEKKGYLTELPVPWVSIMTMSADAAGFLFLDELNQADQAVQNILFSLLNFEERRIAGKYVIKGDWRIHAAGNWGEGYSIYDLVPALKERLAPYYLKTDFEGWATWASNTKVPDTDNPIIHPLLMDFIEEDPEKNFYVRPSKSGDPTKRPNPRNFVALSSVMYDILSGNPNKQQWGELIQTAASLCGSEFAKDLEQFLIANSIIDVGEIFADPSKMIGGKGTNESQVIQRLSVFRRNLKKFVMTFDDAFAALKTPEEKDDLVNKAFNYLYVLDSIFAVEPQTAATLFSVIASKQMQPDLKLFMAALTGYMKSQNNTEAIVYVNNIIKKIFQEVGGNVKAFMGAEDEEDAETEFHINPKAVVKISNILDQFDAKMNA